MGSSSSCNANLNHEQFKFRFTDCSCQCNAKKTFVNDVEQSQTMFLNALMKTANQAEYDISKKIEEKKKTRTYENDGCLDCDCDCGEGVKMGFLFGNTQQQITEKENK